MIFSALQIFLVALCGESRNGPVSNVWNPVVFLFDLDHASSFEIIHAETADCHLFYVR